MKLSPIATFRFLSDEFFIRALRKWGLSDQLIKSGTSAAKLQVTVNEIIQGDRSKGKETELIQRIAELRIYLDALVNALGAQNDTKVAIQTKLEELRDQALRK